MRVFPFWLMPQRPIVEFSLEDGRKLKLKEQRQQKNKVRGDSFYAA